MPWSAGGKRLVKVGAVFDPATRTLGEWRRGKLTLVQTAELCGLGLYDFMAILSQAGIPVIDYDPQELEKELSYFQ